MQLCKRIFLTLLLAAAFAPRAEVSAQDYYGMYGSYNDPCCCCNDPCGQFRVYGEYLYWQISQDQMDYAATLPGGVAGIISPLVGGTMAAAAPITINVNAYLNSEEQKFKWQSGFRIGVGYALPCSDWDIDVSWTRFNNTTRACASDAGGGILPLAFPVSALIPFVLGDGFDPSSIGFATAAQSCWKFEFNTLDIAVGKNMCFCNCVKFRPFVGVKFAQIRQRQHIEYFGIDLQLSDEPMPATVTTMRKNNFDGVGPMFGAKGSWEICNDLYLSSGFSGSLLYGKFKVHNNPLVGFQGNSISLTQNNTRNNRLVPMVDASISLDWDTKWCDDFEIVVGLGYEVEYWWNQWRGSSTVVGNLLTGSSGHYGDLMMQGLTVKLGVGF